MIIFTDLVMIMITFFSEHYSFNVETIFSIRVFYDAPTIPNEKNFAYVESNKIYMLVHHENNALCDSYIVEFIHDATENYYEEEYMLVGIAII